MEYVVSCHKFNSQFATTKDFLGLFRRFAVNVQHLLNVAAAEISVDFQNDFTLWLENFYYGRTEITT